MSRAKKAGEPAHEPASQAVPFPDLNIEAVAAYRLNYLTSESVALTIKNGVVVGVKRITRAPDQHSTAIGQAQGVLWTQSRENPPVKIPKGQPHAE